MPTTSPSSHATTELSPGISVRQESNDSGGSKPPKLVARSSEMSCQSESVAVRISREAEASGARTEVDGAIKRYPNAPDLTTVTSGAKGEPDGHRSDALSGRR